MKRKGRRHLDKVDLDVSDGDIGRSFGWFRWSAFSPAGALERQGFFLRQLARLSRQPKGRGVRVLRRLVPLVWLVLFTTLLVVGLVRVIVQW